MWASSEEEDLRRREGFALDSGDSSFSSPPSLLRVREMQMGRRGRGDSSSLPGLVFKLGRGGRGRWK